MTTTDLRRLRAVCSSFLYETRWAGVLGDPVPPTHKAPRDRRYLTELRHERAICARLIAPDLSQESSPDSQGGPTPYRRAGSACERPHHNAEANAVSQAAGTGRELR